MIVLRFLHVFGGAIWVGMMAFQIFFLGPSLAEAGPAAGAVMAGLMKRRIPVVMPVIALITILSGMMLFQRISGGDMKALMATPMGKAFAWGGAIALIAFLVGVIVMRPLMMKSMKLMQAGNPANAPEVQRLQARATTLGKVVSYMLLITLALMAVARYL
jgi:uncharacterized membrane protein